MREVVAPFLRHEPIRMLEGRYPTPPYPELRTWQDKAWEFMPAMSEEMHKLAEQEIAALYASRRVREFVELVDSIAYGPVPVDVDADEFERTILATRDAYERAMGVTPTVIDLPNWARGTILEQIAFNNGFTIADRREEDDDHPG